jgi:hypothetical protein
MAYSKSGLSFPRGNVAGTLRHKHLTRHYLQLVTDYHNNHYHHFTTEQQRYISRNLTDCNCRLLSDLAVRCRVNSIDLKLTEVSEERIASIFRVEDEAGLGTK